MIKNVTKTVTKKCYIFICEEMFTFAEYFGI